MSEPTTGAPGAGPDGPPAPAKALVLAAISLLVVAAVAGVEAWPLSAWRLFSLSRDAEQSRWVVHAADGDGEVRTVSLEELPLRYRHAEWPMSDLPDASPQEREDLCQAIAGAVAEVHPDVAEVRLVRDRQRLEEAADGWELRHDPEVVHACEPGTPSP